MIKKVLFNIKGMTRDLAASKFNPEFAYENRNMRIMATDDNTSGALVNEKGNLKVNSGIFANGILGTPIGQATIDDELILFTTSDDSDNIYRIYLDDSNSLTGEVLYSGHLKFDVKYPIESISVYENNKLKKVYWTDGLNQPRVINVTDTNHSWNDDSFNFVNALKLKEEITITRNLVASGIFAPGVIQYCFTYFNLYGQETNIFYTSPLYYVSYNNRGASPEDTVSNSFNITVAADTYDTNFDYLRIYCIHRTTLDSTPQARKVVDISLSGTSGEALTYTDTGAEGNTIDPTELLFIGGEEVVAGTMCQKDNTLFLGDLELKRKTLNQKIRNGVKQGNISFNLKHRDSLDVGTPSGIYPYFNQLRADSNELKTFKYLEYYRFGLQAQHYTGKWSEPIWINDKENTTHPEITDSGAVYLPYASFKLNSSLVIKELINSGFVRVRPVVVFPEISEREAVCQGVLCPTVYNVGDRAGNAPFAQASWFFRPNSYLDVEEEKENFTTPIGTDVLNSWGGQVRNDVPIDAVIPEGEETTIDEIVALLGGNFSKGKWVEFRHNKPIPSNNEENAEIQCITDPPETPYINNAGTPQADSWAATNMENFYVDQSIVTLNSPDIEFDTKVRSLDTSNLKLRIIGAINLTASANDLSITSETPVNNYHAQGGDSPVDFKEFPVGFYKESIGTSNLSKFGWRSLVSGGFWMDDVTHPNPGTIAYRPGATVSFVVYPWHRSMSYNNAIAADSNTGYISAKVGKKKMSTLRYSFFNTYLDSDYIWKAQDDRYSNTNTGISDVAIFDSNEVSMIRLKEQQNSNLDKINYYGNIDKLVTFPNTGDKVDGYPIITTFRGDGIFDSEELRKILNLHFQMCWNYARPNETWLDNSTEDSGSSNSSLPYFTKLEELTDQTHALDPVSIKYKSTPHAVIALNYTTEQEQRILPTSHYLKNGRLEDANLIQFSSSDKPFWDKTKSFNGISQDVIDHLLPQYGYLWLGELYNDNVQNRFGGTTDEAFENNVWLPAGEPVSLYKADGSVKSSVELEWFEGDTYYQRYDCLKTYPFTMEDQNSVVDILSFMVETRVNIDGRYDRNRGQTSNLTVSPTNFNLLNPVYSQTNNFFNYRTTNLKKLDLDTFPNTLTWTKTKTLGEEVDTWTNITLASTLDLDGNLGRLRALRRFKDGILSFQDNGISQILYNENVQIASTTGVPIEIANSGKVSGKRYISNKIGCMNKWSICTTPNGLYFYDGVSKDLYLFNGEFNNISDKFGFHSWVIQNLDTTKLWNPSSFDSVITYYDNINNDVMFITKNECLSFSESLGNFSSFYDYGKTPFFATIKDKSIAIHRDDSSEGLPYYPYLHHEGDYNRFYDVYKPYFTRVVVNPNPTTDKIFNNVEFRSDSFNESNELVNDFTFNYLNVWNEYQAGDTKLVNDKDKPSTLKKKFRIWHAQIPRWNLTKNGQIANGRDRMRNPWLYLTLEMTNDRDALQNNYKTVLHDLVVDYFE